jgi:hypothetical protein
MPGWFGGGVLNSNFPLARYQRAAMGECSMADGLRIRLGVHNLSDDQIVAFRAS